MKVFISSTQNDLDLAQDLARRLQGIGLQVFTAKDGKKKKESLPTIDRHLHRLRASDEVIFLLTQNAVRSGKIIFEIGAALSLHKKVTPIVVGVEADELPLMIKHLPYIRYAQMTDYLSKLKKKQIGATAKVHA